MKPFTVNTFVYSRGDVLAEALFGVIIMALVSVGFAKLTTSMLTEKANTKIINATVVEMTALLEKEGGALCERDDVTISVNSKNLPVTITCASDQTLTVASEAQTISFQEPPRVTLEVSLEEFGIDGPSVIVGGDA